jgi:hypothetical protein
MIILSDIWCGADIFSTRYGEGQSEDAESAVGDGRREAASIIAA